MGPILVMGMSAAADMVAPSLPGAGLLNSKVLVLNRSYLPVHISSVKRAFALLYQGVAKAVDEQYHTFEFESWRDLSIEVQHERLGIVNGFIRVPRVLLLTAYERVPKRHVRFSRFNIFARDGNTCQYCHKKLPRTELNLDHVIPRSRGGMLTWEHTVCSCHYCNRRKGGRTPDEAGMLVVEGPRAAHMAALFSGIFSLRRYREWMPYLSQVDSAYWNTELIQD